MIIDEYYWWLIKYLIFWKLILMFLKLSIDYAYLCNVLTNPQWLFGHRFTIFEYGVDGVQE